MAPLADALITSHTLYAGRCDLLAGLLLYKSRLGPRTVALIGIAGACLLVVGYIAVLFGLVGRIHLTCFFWFSLQYLNCIEIKKPKVLYNPKQLHCSNNPAGYHDKLCSTGTFYICHSLS